MSDVLYIGLDGWESYAFDRIWPSQLLTLALIAGVGGGRQGRFTSVAAKGSKAFEPFLALGGS
jgi:hypothetical protein